MRKIALAGLLAGLPLLAQGQEAAQVPAILQSNAASAGTAGPVPSDGANASAAAQVSAGTGAAADGHAAKQAANAVPAGMPPPIQLLSPSAPLNAKEKQGVALAHRWASAPYMPHADADGVIRFRYGATLPTVVCAPLQVCDLALQPGEVVHDITLGDKVRWKVLPGLSGSPAGPVTHLIIKPEDAGLISSMMVQTDRRTYAVKLVSARAQWMPLIAFSYPDDMQDQWSAYRTTVGLPAAGGVAGFGTPAINASNLDFGFRLSGNAPSWRPLRVYSDGSKTYIQFPRPVAFGSAPALVGLSNDGGWFSSPSKMMVNYRILGDRYVVDRVLDRAELVSGVGSGQDRVLITRDGAR